MDLKPIRDYEYKLWYKNEAPFGKEDCDDFTKAYESPYGNESGLNALDGSDDGWEKWSLPLGNGYFGANVFGRKKTERIQITENSLANPYAKGQGGVCSFGDIYIDFDHQDCTHFERNLNLDDAVSRVEYYHKGVHFKREYFTSYPDKVLVIHISTGRRQRINCTVRAELAYCRDYLYDEGDNMGKSGTVTIDDDSILLKGEMHYYGIKFCGKLKVHRCTGTVTKTKDGLKIEKASEVILLFTVATNYKMESRIFLEPDRLKKLAPYPSPDEEVENRLSKIGKRSYSQLYLRHTRDYKKLFHRTDLVIEGAEKDLEKPTDELILNYRKGIKSRYLEQLYFLYGRYLLISSSRNGGYPANLQGIWSRYRTSPWSCGYWHNINVQMNYWASFNANLTELFMPYADYFNAYFEKTKEFADDYVKLLDNGKYEKGNNGWTIGTGCWLYEVSGADKPNSGHSGPGTGGFTAKLFWDYYDFTRDKEFLENTGYKAISEMARFLSKTLEETDGKYLVKYSASPEQFVIKDGKHAHYHTKGCAFDQQMVWETYNDLIKAAEILGVENSDIVKTAKQQIDCLDPVLIGDSGQVKEYREETVYGSIGEKDHRHVSQLIGLYPGTVINERNPEFLEAAKFTLNSRGDKSTGWSTAHKLNMWARLKDGKRSYDLLNMLLSNCTATNLWDLHPPFQIDGNFGGTAGIAEMLVQSHEGYIDILPALPPEWKTGTFKGILARGNFTVDGYWKDGSISKARIFSNKGGICSVKGDIITIHDLFDENVPFTNIGNVISFKTQEGRSYYITFRKEVKVGGA